MHALTSMLTVASLTSALGRQGSLAPHLPALLEPTTVNQDASYKRLRSEDMLMLRHTHTHTYLAVESSTQCWAVRNTTTDSGH
jgi:hypothetical protein